VARASPRLAERVKRAGSSLRSTTTSGCRSATASAVPSRLASSTRITSTAEPWSESRQRRVSSRVSWVGMTIERGGGAMERRL
jgi:hypothetical protein